MNRTVEVRKMVEHILFESEKQNRRRGVEYKAMSESEKNVDKANRLMLVESAYRIAADLETTTLPIADLVKLFIEGKVSKNVFEREGRNLLGMI